MIEELLLLLFGISSVPVQCMPYGCRQFSPGDRFPDITPYESLFLVRRNYFAVPRAENNGDIGPYRENFPRKLHTGDVGHVLISDDKVKEIRGLREHPYGFDAVPHRRHVIAKALKGCLRDVGDVLLIIDEEDSLRSCFEGTGIAVFLNGRGRPSAKLP